MRNLLLFLLLSTTLATASPSLQGAFTWQKAGFSETMIQSEMGRLIPHPTDPNRIYLATVNMPDLLGGTIDPADGLWMTTDGGVNWSTINDAVFQSSFNILDLAICTAAPDVIYAATIEEGIFKTVDGGTTWTDVSGGFQYSGQGFPNNEWGIAAVAVDPTNPDNVYISVAQLGGLDIMNLSPSHPGFFYSHDGGNTWHENNSGLPQRYDNIWDGHSHTAVAASIVVLPQAPDVVILGITDLYVNTSLFFNKNAETRGKVYFAKGAGTGSFSEISYGLPGGIVQGPEIGGSLARVSSSAMMLSCADGLTPGLWASHVSFTFDLSLSKTLMVTRNKGLFRTGTGVWQERNGGLPYVASWTDNTSTTDNIIKFKETYNMGYVAVGHGPFDTICLCGSNRCDMGNAASNNTKVYGTANGAASGWLKNWDSGLDLSPTFGYTEANATYIAFNADMTYAFATVRWSDDTASSPQTGDNGIYRLKIR